ncbi:MAG: hypothetical protein QOE61_2288 [Micromonosporaceae bacterium]|jgi:hypothetical protein|nr:hypothetical protein [Micromonosporaceae bacterium]
MDFSSQLDGLKRQVAGARTAVQAAATESPGQLRQRIDQAQVDQNKAAERFAEVPADYVAWTIDNARMAVLDAIDVGAYVNTRVGTAAS